MRTVDLFSGCGGMSLGFQNAGFEVIAAFDNWTPAVQVYQDNFTHPIYHHDLSLPESQDFVAQLRPELIIGGPPCQDFSSAGKRDENLGRADLTRSFAEIVALCRPPWFVMENVERILKSRILREAFQVLKTAGYGLSYQVLDASLCGVPQTRKRFFVVGCLHAPDQFLNFYFEKNQSRHNMTLHNYFGDKLGIERYYRHPRSYARRGIFSIHEPSPTIRGVNRPVPAGYPGHLGDPVPISENIRPLSTQERSQIQTFPENFIFKTNKTDTEQLVGNAVPVKLAEFVARCIQEYIANHQDSGPIRQGQLQFDYA
jgi:DNA (cytosine-5)-methyltransferase 1